MDRDPMHDDEQNSQEHEASSSEEASAPAHKVSLLGRLRAYFFAGILVTAPISITFYLAWLFIDFVDSRVTPLIPAKYNPDQWSVPGVGLVIVVVFLTLVGAMAAGFLGRTVVRLSESMLERMPVIRTIYGATKQIFETVLAQQSNAFREAALIEYPRRGMWCIAFITGKTTGEIQHRTSEEIINVFIPTTPNPTSGFLLFVPRKEVYILEMTVEEAIKMVVSGGIITPPWPPVDREAKNGKPLPKPAGEPETVSSADAAGESARA